MHEWVADGLYDLDYVAQKTTGFEEWREYLLGVTDGVPKTPEWQEAETGLPAKDVRSLAGLWARRKTYLAAGGLGSGFGGACRSATGAQWARCMVMIWRCKGGANRGSISGICNWACRWISTSTSPATRRA